MITTRRALATRVENLVAIHEALTEGGVLHWGDGERVSRSRVLRELGIELVSATAMKKRGHVLKRGQRPVACAYYGAPIKKYVDLYVLGIQTRPK